MLRSLREFFREVVVVLRHLPGLFVEMLAVLRLVRTILRAIIWGFIVKPRGLGETIQIKKELSGMLYFKLRTQLNPVTALDVVTQRMTITDALGEPIVIAGVSKPPVEVPASATQIEYWVGPLGATNRRVFDYIDASGLDSANFEDDYVVVDQIGPEAPIGLGETVQVEQFDDGT